MPAKGRNGDPRKPPTQGTRTRLTRRVRCTARSAQSGERCRRWAIAGAFVCATHGGSAPQVKKAAALRLLEATDPAAAKLVALIDDEDPAVRLRACTAILDRAGYGPGSQLDVNLHTLARSTEWYELRGRIIEALRPYPAAAQAVADALEDAHG